MFFFFVDAQLIIVRLTGAGICPSSQWLQQEHTPDSSHTHTHTHTLKAQEES